MDENPKKRYCGKARTAEFDPLPTKMKIPIALLLITLAQFSLAQTATDWRYLYAYGGNGSWSINERFATLERKGSRVVLTAFSSTGEPSEKITARVAKNKVRAIRNNLASENFDELLSGTYASYGMGGKCVEVFSVNNEYAMAGWSRTVSYGEPMHDGRICKKTVK